MLKKGARLKSRADFPSTHVFDYKDPSSLIRFLAEGGKIVPSRISKLSQMQQRKLTRAIKKSRNIGLLPMGSEAYDRAGRIEPISPKPFEI